MDKHHTNDDNSIRSALSRLSLAQMKELLQLFGLEKPHSRSTKEDYITYILSSGRSLDATMLINFANRDHKPKPIKAIKAKKHHSKPHSESEKHTDESIFLDFLNESAESKIVEKPKAIRRRSSSKSKKTSKNPR